MSILKNSKRPSVFNHFFTKKDQLIKLVFFVIVLLGGYQLDPAPPPPDLPPLLRGLGFGRVLLGFDLTGDR